MPSFIRYCCFGLVLTRFWSRWLRHQAATGCIEAITLLVPCAVALLCAAIDLKYGSSHPAKSASQLERRRLRINKLLLYAVPAFIILALGVPPGTWRYLAGQIFVQDWCHHLNFFFMGPAISFNHGKAFGTEIYSQYGIGWPLLASILSHFWALTYGNLVGMEIVYCCTYYLALFFLLRTFFKQQLWAAFGVVLAIYWQAFSGMKPTEIIWRFPSSTPMRHPMDVWFFLALALHQRSGKLHWAALAGLAAALGVFFETETGAYLVVSFFIYSVLQAGVAVGERPKADAKGWLCSTLAFYSTAGLTLLALLLAASRGTLFTGAFWHGWVEALVAYAGGGVGALPIAELPDAPLILFMIMVATYLAVILYAAVRALHGNASRNLVLLATLAAYGLASLLIFVSRSHPFNLCHAAIPFAVVLTALIAQGHAVLERSLPGSLLPYALLSGLVLLLLTKTEFLSYPSFLRSNFVPAAFRRGVPQVKPAGCLWAAANSRRFCSRVPGSLCRHPSPRAGWQRRRHPRLRRHSPLQCGQRLPLVTVRFSLLHGRDATVAGRHPERPDEAIATVRGNPGTRRERGRPNLSLFGPRCMRL